MNNLKTLIVYGEDYVIVDNIKSLKMNFEKHQKTPIVYVDANDNIETISNAVSTILKVTLDDAIIYNK